MDRRTIIKQISLMTGAAFIGGEIFIQSGCTSKNSNHNSVSLSTDQLTLMDDIGEAIIPATDTPGSKSIGIGSFMQKMVTDCYSLEQQKIFVGGLEEIKVAFDKKFSIPFSQGSAIQKEEFLNEFNAKITQYNKNKKEGDPDHFFLMLKQLTILGYFSSETGATQALRYIAVPGKYDGSYPYTKGDKAWAS